MDEEHEIVNLNGVIESVSYTNEDNGYTVLKIRDENDKLQTVVGCMPNVFPGEKLFAYGTWTNHNIYGPQFKADYAEIHMPSNAQEIFDYLAGGAIKGIGAATAAQIVNRFGADSLAVIESSPEKLTAIKGITKSKAQEFSQNFKKHRTVRQLLDFICSVRDEETNRNLIRPVIALRLYKFYGTQSMEILQMNPYIIVSPHIGGKFSEADSLAQGMGIPMDDPNRVKAAAIFELRYNLNNGHCFIPKRQLIDASARLIDVNRDLAEEIIDELTKKNEIVFEEINNVGACYLPDLFEAENEVASMVAVMAKKKMRPVEDLSSLLSRVEKETKVSYSEIQQKILKLALENQILIITGGPGTGKTTSIKAILEAFDCIGLKTLLTAPTGRAAKRMTEVTGREATTVHRLLGARFSEDGDGIVFSKNEESPLSCNAVVLDECSMVDLLLFHSLLQALPADARLIMVGDADQLPSVGPGNIFRSIITSGVVPTMELKDIFRQAEDSRIVHNAHMINQGEHPDFGENRNDFFRLSRMEPASAVATLKELCAERLPKKMGIPSDEIQVLSITRKGMLGTVNLNRELQSILNPASEKKKEKLFGEIVFREGDRIMQVRNDYDIPWRMEDNTSSGLGIFNGDIGKIQKIDQQNEVVECNFDGKIALYSYENLGELEHAWAITVHKSQGCEFRAVLFALGEAAPTLLSRAVLYTGVTRAKKLLIFVGNEGIANRMIDNAKISNRFTFLRYRLRKAAIEEK